MSKLTPTQTEALVNAAQREDGSVLPLPSNVTPGLIGRVINGLESRGLIEEHGDLYCISDAGREAIADKIPKSENKIKAKPKPQKKAKAENESEETIVKKKTKKQQLIEMLERDGGASLNEIEKTLGWQKHTVRGTISNLMNKDGYTIESSKNEAGDRVYAIKD
ncbi:DUF3489 domain-containing protein [Teredinibacter sp. KSP-S5-2]|uniref:DUF3489 domain-containing protein n=1 Tax=Teredinibacter sp. KSP-S5-2 TaxID=3034506 RepID=UPI0029351D49|nr:DUF3489 domain-containing protein [Teredinibacter sp. KSP-S5-2]WNO10418.1 DUF3489 domain-containing protein [Teredinibacter sp. KSP-S5-2]